MSREDKKGFKLLCLFLCFFTTTSSFTFCKICTLITNIQVCTKKETCSHASTYNEHTVCDAELCELQLLGWVNLHGGRIGLSSGKMRMCGWGWRTSKIRRHIADMVNIQIKVPIPATSFA